jgi:hypothetical protein
MKKFYIIVVIVAKATFSKIYFKSFSFVPWSCRSRRGSASVHRSQVAVVRRRAQNEAAPPINGNLDR